MKYTVHSTPQVRAAIKEQARYLAFDQQSPQNAIKWLERIYKAADGLDEMPNRCSIAEEDEHKDYEVRKQGVDGFNLLFTVFEDKKETWIIATRGRGMGVNPEQLPEDVRAVADGLREAESQRDEGQEPGQGMER